MEYFAYRGGFLHAENVSVIDISEQVGTPFYVYSASAIEKSYRDLERELKAVNHSISYAVKANSNIAILRLIAQLGSGMDVVSSGEYRRAIAAGVPGEKIVFSGVGKTKEEMLIAATGGVKQFNVESEEELFALNAVARSIEKVVPVSIRVNPNVNADTHEKISTGKSDNKFGIPITEVAQLVSKVKKCSNIKFVGLAVHIGSQLTDLSPYKKSFEKIADLVKSLQSAGHKVTRLDLGGGLGIAYKKGAKVINISKYVQLVTNIFSDLRCELEFEPGRLIVGNAGILVCSAIYTKSYQSRNFLIVDGAMIDLLRPAIYDAYHDIITIRESNCSNDRMLYDVVGPICETGDTFTRNRSIPKMRAGDLIAFASSGAYGATMASEYNTRPLVPEILVKNGNFDVIRARPSIESIIKKDIVPDWLR
ncbi:MAG: diaminopimelate decarboxylase [Pseudomonadota bacterium]|nr:diaminopimelate decarboxylase [Pseudomonadota bacterium]